MSFDPFGRSTDLGRLAAAGFDLELTAGGHLLVKRVPFRAADGQVDRGTIVTKVEMDGDVTVNPVQDHTVRFIGSVPCDVNGPLHAVINNEAAELEQGLQVNHHLSLKNPEALYLDYEAKILAYVNLISAQAQAIDPDATAQTNGPVVVDNADWPFEYVDTASGRAGIGALSACLAEQRVGIVGLGGTGSYILDLVAKCPVQEIHLFDGDRFSTHNAFRTPGAPSLDDLRGSQLKVDYLHGIYAKMKRGVIAHPYPVDSSNASELVGLSFVFLAMEGGEAKREIVEVLDNSQVAFVDCSLGVVRSGGDGPLMATVGAAGSTPDDRESLHGSVDFGAIDDEDPYAENIQTADLNVLNAALAVLMWKKLSGFYYSSERQGVRLSQRYTSAFDRLVSD